MTVAGGGCGSAFRFCLCLQELHPLPNLEQAEIIRSFLPFGRGVRSKLRTYALADEYLYFYYRYIAPNRRTIAESDSPRLFELLAGG